MRPHLPSAASTSRPNWMLLAMALPVGMLLDRLTGGWENLSGSILILMGWLHSPTVLQRHTASMVSHLVVPALLVFMVLKATRLGAWLAPNRLALGCLLVADAVLVGVALRSLLLAAMGEPPFVSSTLAAVATASHFTPPLPGLFISLKAETYDLARSYAPGWDVHGLEGEWRAWIEKKSITPHRADSHFLAFCKRRGKYPGFN